MVKVKVIMVNDYTTYQQVQPQAFTIPAGRPMSSPVSPSAVNINIISPSVYGQGQSQIPYAPIYNYPQAQTPPPPPVMPSVTATATATANAAPAPLAATPVQPEIKPPSKKEVVPLTDEYIKTLESYINNSNEQVRVTGMKQVMSRFKDDDSRKRDASLTALLNKGLSDKSNNVRFLAMTIIASGYAAGDNTTVGLLNNIQKEKTNYNEDALLASQALSKMAELAQSQKVEVQES